MAGQGVTIRDVRTGHTVAFAHDIYFEWAYLHWLLENGAEWPAALAADGDGSVNYRPNAPKA